MTNYLTADDIIQIHDLEVRAGGGVRDQSLLEAAVGRPQQSAFGDDAFPTLALKAAALFDGIAEYQVFLDGNKRTAVLAVVNFYAINGYTLKVDEVVMYDLALDLANKVIEFESLALSFERWAEPIPDPAE